MSLYAQVLLFQKNAVQPLSTCTMYMMGMNWMYCNKAPNPLAHSLNGNRRNIGYNYFLWNCDRGIISENKLDDIKNFAAKKKPHVMGILEVNMIHNENNRNPENKLEFSTKQVLEKFKINDYKIILPDSWESHNKARMLVNVAADLKVKKCSLHPDETHLQSGLLEVGFGRSSTHLVNLYYREWSSVQMEDLIKLLNIWTRCTNQNKDFLSLGDLNLCAKTWDEPGYRHASLANKVKDFMLAEDCTHLVTDYTRIRQVLQTTERSCLDQVITNCVSKMTSPQIHSVGKSDHMGVFSCEASLSYRNLTDSLTD